MYHHDRGLIVILVIALFSLASLQGLNLLLNHNQSNVLGDISTCSRNYYTCSSNSECCSNYCQNGTCRPISTNLPTPVSLPTIIPTPANPVTIFPSPSANSVPCAVITQLQQQYCGNVVKPTPVSATTTPPRTLTPTSVQITPSPARTTTITPTVRRLPTTNSPL